tara:strand:+ start:500 stop:883 length:384 start_codon:yes stop_codon:yes gene_type:complete
MVIIKKDRRKEQGSVLLAELIGAMLVLTLAMMPIILMLAKDQQTCRKYYFKAVAMEVVDGEMEVLRAGYWKEFEQGVQTYPTTANSVTNLPEGELLLTLEAKRMRLEWKPKEERYRSVHVVREVDLP